MNKPGNTAQPNDPVQGEGGDYDAARRYDKAARGFAESGRVEEAARDAKPTSTREAHDLRRAERKGMSHSKGQDPLLNPGMKSDRRKESG